MIRPDSIEWFKKMLLKYKSRATRKVAKPPGKPFRDELEQRVLNFMKAGWTSTEALEKIASETGMSPEEADRIISQTPDDYNANQSGDKDRLLADGFTEHLHNTVVERIRRKFLDSKNTLILVVAILLAVFIYCLGTRFQMVSIAKGESQIVYMYNRFSGKIWVVGDILTPYAIPVTYVSDEIAQEIYKKKNIK